MNPTENDSARGVVASAAAVPALTVSALKLVLAAAPELPLTVLWPDGDPLEAHLHVTEVGRVQ